MFKKNLKLIKKIYQSDFELATAIASIIIIIVAIAMDKLLFLQACPMCILTRYVFGMVALSAAIGALLKKPIISNLLESFLSGNSKIKNTKGKYFLSRV